MSGQRPDGGLREAPGAELRLGPAGLRCLWDRLRLVPFILLLLCVLAASIVGLIARERLAAVDPQREPASAGAGLPSACGPAPEAIPADQPWAPERREQAEAVWRTHMAAERLPLVEGEDGWVFWGDVQAQNFSQALGRRALNRQELAAWSGYLRRLQNELAARDVDLIVQIVPAKWTVYPQQLPEWAQQLRGATSFELLRSAHPELPILDMRQRLREASAGHPVYTPRNSHWTAYGADIGWAQLSECLLALDPARYAGLAALPAARYEPAPEGSEFAAWGYPSGEPADVRPVRQAAGGMTVRTAEGVERRTVTEEAVDMLDLPVTTLGDAPQSEASALILRDSQGTAIAPGWQAGFARTDQYAHDLDHPERAPDPVALAERLRPDVVVLEFTERHLHYPPGQGG
ncbi:MAG: hypothetical protein Q4E05_04100 [Pseudoclavibacter sp.]|nr:hypothetical protein [Pseudoclavibacter sp.]